MASPGAEELGNIIPGYGAVTTQQHGRTSMIFGLKFAISATKIYTQANQDDLTQPSS